MRNHWRVRFGLAGVAIVAVAAVAIAGRGQPTAADAGSDVGIVGSWAVTTWGDAPSQLVTFTADGAVLFSSATAFPVPPHLGLSVTRVFGSAGHGTWIKTGERQYAGRFMSLLFDDEANLVVAFTSDFTITLNPGGDSFSVSARHEFRAPDGALVDSGGGPAQARRIRVNQ